MVLDSGHFSNHITRPQHLASSPWWVGWLVTRWWEALFWWLVPATASFITYHHHHPLPSCYGCKSSNPGDYGTYTNLYRAGHRQTLPRSARPIEVTNLSSLKTGLWLWHKYSRLFTFWGWGPSQCKKQFIGIESGLGWLKSKLKTCPAPCTPFVCLGFG